MFNCWWKKKKCSLTEKKVSERIFLTKRIFVTMKNFIAWDSYLPAMTNRTQHKNNLSMTLFLLATQNQSLYFLYRPLKWNKSLTLRWKLFVAFITNCLSWNIFPWNGEREKLWHCWVHLVSWKKKFCSFYHLNKLKTCWFYECDEGNFFFLF